MSAVIYPTTNLMATEQLVIDRGEGVYVYDRQGKQYLEGMAGLWCTALGYGNQELVEAASEIVPVAVGLDQQRARVGQRQKRWCGLGLPLA